MRLDAVAHRFDLALRGDGGLELVGVCSLAPGIPDRVAYLAHPRHAQALAATTAGVVILAPDQAEQCPVAALIAANPQLAYARVAALFEAPPPPAGIDAHAVIAADAQVDGRAAVAPGAVVGAGARIEAGAVLASGCVIGANCVVGQDSQIGANVVLHQAVVVGARVQIGAGTVIGARGFGLARDGERWVAIPQLGAVVIGDDVEVGAGCTIDRGAIGDTVIEQGVKIDDQVHIAHNCRIGAHTVIAGCAGVAGSAEVGKRCMIGGGVRISDHVRLADDVVLTGATQVAKSIDQPGIYSSTLRALPVQEWNRSLVSLRKVSLLEKRLRRLERSRES